MDQQTGQDRRHETAGCEELTDSRSSSYTLQVGVGATSGGMAGAAIGSAIAGVAGAAVGAMFGGLLGACSGEGIARAVHGADGIEPVEHADFLPNEDYTREVFSYCRKEFGQTRDYCILPDDHCAGFALPWDQVRPFTKRGWERLCGVLGPRDTNRGLRGGI